MADNVAINVAGGGTASIASDDISGTQVQRLKIGWGTDGTYQDASAANPLPVQDVAGNLVTGRKTGNANTPVALATSTPCRGVFVVALPLNAGRVMVGDANVNATDGAFQGISLLATDSVFVPVDNLADVFIVVATNGEGVSYTYFT